MLLFISSVDKNTGSKNFGFRIIAQTLPSKNKHRPGFNSKAILFICAKRYNSPMEKYSSAFDRLFSLFVLVTICMLAAYMAVRIGTQALMFFEHVMMGQYMDMDFMDEHSKRALHAIAEVLILIKAYRILMSYLKTHHISVEYIVEISIIASAIELLFAYDTHSFQTLLVFAGFGLSNLIIYLYFFGPEHDEDLHKAVKKHKKRS